MIRIFLYLMFCSIITSSCKKKKVNCQNIEKSELYLEKNIVNGVDNTSKLSNHKYYNSGLGLHFNCIDEGYEERIEVPDVFYKSGTWTLSPNLKDDVIVIKMDTFCPFGPYMDTAYFHKEMDWIITELSRKKW